MSGPTPETDYITEKIGKFGKFQLRGFLLIQFVGIISAWQTFSTSFILPEVEFWCSPASLQLERGQRPDSRLVVVSPSQEETNTTDHCLMFTGQSDNVTQCSRFDFSRDIFPESVISEFSLVCEREYLISLQNSIFVASWMAANILLGMFSDRFGRKKTLVIFGALETITGVALSFSPNITVFIILRTALGFCDTGLFMCGFVYCLEMVGGIWTTLLRKSFIEICQTGFLSFGLEYSWSLGYITTALLAWLLPTWSHLQLFISIPALLLALALALIIPESPRWLRVTGRHEEAEAVLEVARKMNKRDEVAEVEIRTESTKDKAGSVFDLFKVSSLRWCTIILYYIWFTNNLIYYGFTLNADSLIPGDLYINTIIGGSLEMVAYTVSILCFLYLGRIVPMSFCMIVGGLSLLLTAALSSELAKQILSQAGRFLITASFAMVYQYTTEMMPTVVRNSGLGSCAFMGRIGSIIAPYIGREMLQVSPIGPTLIFGTTSLLAGLLIPLLPETRNKTAPDTIQEGEELCKMSNKLCSMR